MSTTKKEEVPVPLFAGDSAETGAAYIRRFERIARFNNWDEEEIILHFLRHMQGKAAAWIGDIQESILDNWETLKQEFIKHFAGKSALVDPGLSLKELRQGKHQSVEHYAQVFQSLCNELELAFDSRLARELFIAGLQPNIQILVLAQVDKTLDEIIRYAASVDSVLRRTSGTGTWPQAQRFGTRFEQRVDPYTSRAGPMVFGKPPE